MPNKHKNTICFNGGFFKKSTMKIIYANPNIMSKYHNFTVLSCPSLYNELQVVFSAIPLFSKAEVKYLTLVKRNVTKIYHGLLKYSRGRHMNEMNKHNPTSAVNSCRNLGFPYRVCLCHDNNPQICNFH